jgi:hypothetical protein
MPSRSAAKNAQYNGSQTREAMRSDYLAVQAKSLSFESSTATAGLKELQSRFGSGPHWFLETGDAKGPSQNKRRRGWSSNSLTFQRAQQVLHPEPSARQFGRGFFADARDNRYNRGTQDSQLFIKLKTRTTRHPRENEVLELVPLKQGGRATSVVVASVFIVHGRQTGTVTLTQALQWEGIQGLVSAKRT